MNVALNTATIKPFRLSPQDGALSGKSKRSSCVCAVSVGMPVKSPTKGGSLYQLLRVEPSATIAEIKTAYRSLAKVYHPDLSGNGRDFIEIHNAYETLSDPAARAVYDRSLARRMTRAASFGYSGGRSGFHSTRRWETDQCW